MSLSNVRVLFLVAGLYDFLIGLAFLLWGARLFESAGLAQPNHWGFVQFGALLLLIFGGMFLAVANRPLANRNLIPFGVLLKASYVGLVGYYWATTGCPLLFKPFLVVDLVMLVLFVVAFFSTQGESTKIA